MKIGIGLLLLMFQRVLLAEGEKIGGGKTQSQEKYFQLSIQIKSKENRKQLQFAIHVLYLFLEFK